MDILGISAFYHDSAACLLRDGRIVAAAQEERFSRRKHDAAFPRQAIAFCLREGRTRGAALGCVAFYEKPFLKFERLLETSLAFAPRGIVSFIQAMPVWLKQRLWLKDSIRAQLGYDGEIVFPEHHESHAASAFLASPFREAAFLCMDGVGEWATASYGAGKDASFSILGQLVFPHSLGLLYSAFTYYAGFKVNSGEYKLMGLAPYGAPVYRERILDELLDLKEDGSFRLNLRYFDYCTGRRMVNRRFERLFGGPARRPGQPIERRHMDVARSIQDVTGEIMLRMARHVHRETGQERLCLGGGVALNCVGNGRILREGPFREIWIQPAAGDAGGAVGAALIAWHGYLGNGRVADGRADGMSGSFLGPEFSRKEIRAFLRERGLSFLELTAEELPGRVADLVAAQKVVGWFQGRMEFGPRALGNRSIIGDARSGKMQEIMNLRIKFRESFRPFAPSVTRERAGDYFDISCDSPYMLLVAPVREERRVPAREGQGSFEGFESLRVRRSEIPAVTHVDGSARVHTVRREDNPLFHELIRCFDERHGCPVIINTSFNVRGEPIVCSPADAYECFAHTNMDCLVLGNFLLEKTGCRPSDGDGARFRRFERD